MSTSNEPEVRWRISPLQLPDLPSSLEVTGEGLTFGRLPANSVVLTDDRHPGVSGTHARLRLDGGQLVLEDLGSTNGTLVGGEEIERRPLENGEVFELGLGGPRFMVLSSAAMGETVMVPRPGLAKKRSIGPDTVRLVREELGIPQEQGVQQMLKRRGRRHLVVLGAVAVTLALAGVVALRGAAERSERAVEGLTARAAALDEELGVARADTDELRRAWQDHQRQLAAATASWDADKLALEAEREELEGTISRLEQDEATAEGDIAELKGRLEETSRTLERYNPLSLEHDKLAKVAGVVESVVLVEANKFYRERTTNQILHIDESLGGISLNFADEGEPLMVEATGSGFCISPDGWIITNAHVVHKKSGTDEITAFDEFDLVADIELNVVFSGRDDRHSARLISWKSDDKEDLALLKIEPFEGIPSLPEFDVDLDPPARGSEVFLMGFPLGKRVMHEGDRMIASTFKGIVSRSVEYYLQVDAAVHPGASGGPLIDGNGRVRGVVVGMQSLEDNQGSSAIGYIIPVAEVRTVWPPAQDNTH